MKPGVLYSEVREINGRLTVESFDDDVFATSKVNQEIPGVLDRGSNGQIIQILKPLEEGLVRKVLRDLRKQRIETIAYSYLYPNHETRTGQFTLEEGFSHF